VPFACQTHGDGLTTTVAKTQELIVFGFTIRFNGDPLKVSALATAGFNGERNCLRLVALHLLQEPAPHMEILPIRHVGLNR